MKKKKVLAMSMAAVMAAGMLAGCGSDGGSTGSSASAGGADSTDYTYAGGRPSQRKTVRA